jgi:hypothetical protein
VGDANTGSFVRTAHRSTGGPAAVCDTASRLLLAPMYTVPSSADSAGDDQILPVPHRKDHFAVPSAACTAYM